MRINISVIFEELKHWPMHIMGLTDKTSFICITCPALLNHFSYWHCNICELALINIQHHYLIISCIGKSFPYDQNFVSKESLSFISSKECAHWSDWHRVIKWVSDFMWKSINNINKIQIWIINLLSSKHQAVLAWSNISNILELSFNWID